MKLIGLTGFEGAGKSTAAQYLVERHGFTRLSFAAPLKKMLRTLNPIVGSIYGEEYTLSEVIETYGGDENAVKNSGFGDEYRRLMQVLGTECVRAEQEDFWTLAADRQMSDPNANYVFDDTRFPNEAQFVLDKSPWGLWCVEREGYGPVNGHASAALAGNLGETTFLWNNSLESLHDQLDHAVEQAFEDVSV